MPDKDCMGKIDVDDSKCVPGCRRFMECYNRLQGINEDPRAKAIAADLRPVDHDLEAKEASIDTVQDNDAFMKEYREMLKNHPNAVLLRHAQHLLYSAWAGNLGENGRNFAKINAILNEVLGRNR